MGGRHVADTPRLASVALPTEHGGWSLTLEPVALGLIVAPSAAGFLLGVAALLAFLLRAPLRVVLVDARRSRRLPRTRTAARLAVAEAVVLGAVLFGAAVLADAAFWVPLVLAAPFVVVALAFDAASRSRRAPAEIAGSVGIAAVAAAIALAAGEPGSLASGLWLIAAGRAVAAIAFVRVQVRRIKGQEALPRWSDIGQAAAVGLTAIAWGAGLAHGVAVAMMAVIGLVHAVFVRQPAPRVAIVGAQQVVLGLTLVLVVGLATAAP